LNDFVLESRVNLPYHQPEPKPLQDFLARAAHPPLLVLKITQLEDKII
jgi:hypothetical protein